MVIAALAAVTAASVSATAPARASVADRGVGDATISSTSAASCPAPSLPAVPDLPYRTDFGEPQHRDCAVSNGAPIDFGEVDTPPPAVRAPDRGVDVIAHWYQGFGLENTLRSSNWNGWYDWRWNSTANTGDAVSSVGYDPSRHPLIGNYSGDDPDVLGWIAYWLANAGVNVVSFPESPGFTTDGWGDTRDWRTAYFEQTPNQLALDYVLAIGTRGKPAEIARRAEQLVGFYDTRPGAYAESVDGKQYAVVNAWDLESLRGSFDGYNGSKKSEAFLVDLADQFRAVGYDGVTVLGRNGGVLASTAKARLAAKGVRVMFSTYEGKYGSTAGTTSMSQYLDGLDLSANIKGANSVVGVFTSLDTVYPHGSTYQLGDASPEEFARYLAMARRTIIDKDLPRMMTVYNVSEWAEGGPGLIPNMRDGFGFLEALRTMEPLPA